MTFQDAVKELRTATALGREKFAARVGVSAQTIFRWETGHRVQGQGLESLTQIAIASGRPELSDFFQE